MGWVSAILAIASIAYQAYQAKRAKKKAKRDADKRRGFEIVTEGEISALPIVYGKNRIGGNRVWHAVSRYYAYHVGNADKTFQVGTLGTSRKTDNVEILYFQQAICQAPIHSVREVLVNDLYINNYKFSKDDSGLRFEIHYEGNEYDLATVKNFAERRTAVFTDTAYASCFIDLNKEEPQFGGVPDINFLVEGRLIRKVVSGSLNVSFEYSNNPAWCLLDYLLTVKKLNVNSIDLDTFEAAAEICEKVVLVGAKVSGKFYQSTDGVYSSTIRNVPLYECNLTLDSKDSIRTNVEKILDTMGDARLVWSQGKYKLSLEYPGPTNLDINVSDTIDDSKIILGKEVKIDWPSTTDRYNFATVRFGNEFDNFKEDTASWPQKTTGLYYNGSAAYYDIAKGWPGSIPLVSGDTGYDPLLIKYKDFPVTEAWGADTKLTGLHLINEFGVWDGDNVNVVMTWEFIASSSGTHKFQYTADPSATFSFNGTPYVSNSDVTVSEAVNINLTAGIKYTIIISATKTGELAGVAAVLEDPSGINEWTTRAPAVETLNTINLTDTVYQIFLAEDNNIELETDVYAEGCTDPYHAKAIAEELVRTSRTAFVITLTVILTNKYYEPGDILEIQSSTLKLGYLPEIGQLTHVYIRVDNLKLLDDSTIEITGSRFDGSQLAWNVADDEYAKPGSIYSGIVPAPSELIFTPSFGNVVDSAGTLSWPSVYDGRVVGYALYMHIDGNLDTSGQAIYDEIGRTTKLEFSLPNLIDYNVIFGIRSYTIANDYSVMRLTDLKDLSRASPLPATSFTASAAGDNNQAVRLDWVLPTLRDDGSTYNNHYATWIFRSKVDTFASALKIGETQNISYYIDTPSEYGDLYYWVVVVSHAGTTSDESLSDTINVSSPDIWDQLTGSTFTPAAPTSLTAFQGFNAIILNWVNPSYSEEGGQYITRIYGVIWPDGDPEPVFGDGQLLAKVIQSTFFRHTVDLGERWIFWVKEESRGGGVSTGYAGPANITTNLIETVDITENAITTPLLAANSVVAGKIAADQIYGYHILAGEITADKIDSRNLTIKDGAGDIILGAGTALDWSTYVGGDAKPADYATSNIVYKQPTEPSSPTDDDFWVDTSYDPYVTKTYKSGVWTVSSSVGATFVNPEGYVEVDYWSPDFMNVGGTIDHPGAVYGQIDQFNASTYIASAAIGSAQIANLLVSKNYVPNSSGWVIDKEGRMEINDIYARGTIESSILKGCIIVSTQNVRETIAGDPYYTAYTRTKFNSGGLKSAANISTYVVSITSKNIPLYAYNSGPVGTENLGHTYDDKIEIYIETSIPWGQSNACTLRKIEIVRASDNVVIATPFLFSTSASRGGFSCTYPNEIMNGLTGTLLGGKVAVPLSEPITYSCQTTGYKIKGTCFVPFTHANSPNSFVYVRATIGANYPPYVPSAKMTAWGYNHQFVN